jgi:hypothetical protein
VPNSSATPEVDIDDFFGADFEDDINIDLDK